MKKLVMIVLASALSMSAFAEGGKNRIADEDIDEGYVLCERDGVTQVTIEEDGIQLVIDCELVPGPSYK